MHQKIKTWILLVILAATPLLALAQPAQVIVIRHAEKPEDPDAQHLSPRGEERAKALVKFFTENKKAMRYGPPVALYANRPTRRGNGQRSQETLQPLANKLGISVQTPYESEDYEKLARDILKNPNFKGKTVVICWVHEYLPVLASALGVEPTPDEWKGSIYDRSWLITYDRRKPKLDTVWQKLLPGDKKYKPE